MNVKKATKKYVLIKGREGLGNRILSSLTGILYAKITNRKYYIDWSDSAYSQNNINVFHSFFDCPYFSQNEKLPETKSIFPHVWINNLHKSSLEVTTSINYHRSLGSSAHLGCLNYPHDVLVVWMCIPEVYLLKKYFKKFIPEYKGMPDDYIFRDLFRKNFILKKDIQERIDKFKKENFTGQKVIGVHIRYTDKMIKFDKFINKVSDIRKKHRDAKIFLSTDSSEVIDVFRKKFGKILFTEKWFPHKGEIMHQNHSCPDRIANGIEALVDVYLLAKCDYLIYAHCSTFGYIANILSDIPDENRFDINKKKLKEIVPKVVRRSIWEFIEKMKGVPIAKYKSAYRLKLK